MREVMAADASVGVDDDATMGSVGDIGYLQDPPQFLAIPVRLLSVEEFLERHPPAPVAIGYLLRYAK